MNQSSKANGLGRAWIYDDEPTEINLWEHEFDPIQIGRRSGADWCLNHMAECYDDSQLREIFGLPDEGNFQVLFKWEISGRYSGYEYPEWDEDVEIDDVRFHPVTDEYMKFVEEENARKREENKTS